MSGLGLEVCCLSLGLATQCLGLGLEVGCLGLGLVPVVNNSRKSYHCGHRPVKVC